MPFKPWLTQPERTEDEHEYDPNDPGLLINILKPNDPNAPLFKDWFLDHDMVNDPPLDK